VSVLEEMYKDQLAYAQKLEKALELACRMVEEQFGTCPVDQFGWDCPHNCNDELWRCWREYFIEMTKEAKSGDYQVTDLYD